MKDHISRGNAKVQEIEYLQPITVSTLVSTIETWVSTVYNGEADHDREADQYNYIHGRVKQDV